MAFWNRLRQSQLHKLLSNQFQKCNLQSCTSNQASLHSRFGSLLHNHLPNNVRFFAAPVQAKKKEVDTSGPKMNEMITSPVVRLILEEGHKVISRSEALDIARRQELDLVEVDRKAKPPVCKLLDYNKERYKQQVLEKERGKSSKANLKKGTIKEIRFAGQITPKDLQLKADTARRLLEEGYRLKCQVKRKKKEDDLGKCLSRLLSLIEDVALVEFGPNVDEDQAQFILRHVKLGKLKHSPKKASKVASPSSASGELESGIESEKGSESDEDDQVSDDEDGATSNARPNKEEVTTLPVNRYARPTSRGPPSDSAGRPAAPITENRYNREPRNNIVPPPAERGRQPQFNRMQPPPTERGRQPPPPIERVRQPPPPTERGRQPQFNATSPNNRENQRPGFNNPNFPGNFPRQNPPFSSYGNVGAPDSPSTHEQQNKPAQTNRYKKK